MVRKRRQEIEKEHHREVRIRRWKGNLGVREYESTQAIEKEHHRQVRMRRWKGRHGVREGGETKKREKT